MNQEHRVQLTKEELEENFGHYGEKDIVASQLGDILAIEARHGVPPSLLDRFTKLGELGVPVTVDDWTDLEKKNYEPHKIKMGSHRIGIEFGNTRHGLEGMRFGIRNSWPLAGDLHVIPYPRCEVKDSYLLQHFKDARPEITNPGIVGWECIVCSTVLLEKIRQLVRATPPLPNIQIVAETNEGE